MTGNGSLRSGAILSKLSWGMRSESGPIREHNEDFAGAYAPTVPDDAWDRGPLFAVADGLGGHAAGEVASRAAVEALVETWRSDAPADPTKSLRAGVRRANTAVFDLALTDGHSGMATTLTALTLAGREAIVAHVGDSRAYLVRNAEVQQLTVDHSHANDMVRLKMLTPEQAANHPARSQLSRAVGTDLVVPVDVRREKLEAGDTFVLCSDGLWNDISDTELTDVVAALAARRLPTAVAAADALVDLALSRQAADNVTVVVVHVPSGLPIPAAGAKRRPRFLRGRAP